MVNCPACEADMDLDEDQLTEGGVVSCSDCGAHFEVTNHRPLELGRLDEDEDEEDEDDDYDSDDDDEEDEDEEDEEAEYDDEDDLLDDDADDDE